jgi:hypothetical protein
VYTKSDWLIPAGLIAFAFIPVVAGIVRLASLAGGPEATPDLRSPFRPERKARPSQG